MVYQSSRIAYSVLLIGLLLRLAFVHYLNPVSKFIYSDMGNYVYVAELIMKGEWRITHFFQPIGFPYVILLLKMITPSWTNLLGIIQILMGTATAFFVWRTARETFGEKIGLASLIVASIHLPWITFTGFALSETSFIFLLSILLWLTLKLIRKPSLLLSFIWTVIFFLAFLMKGTHIFYGPLFVIGIYYFQRKSSLKYIAAIGFTMATLLIAHGFFAQAKVGKFLMSANAGGLNFVEGKCPQKNNADNAGYSWLSPLYYQLDMHAQKKWNRPFSDSGYFMQEGLKCIQRNPFVLIQSLEGIPYLFTGNTLWPANQTLMANQVRLYELFFAIFCFVGLAVYVRFYRTGINKEEEMLVWVLPILSVFLCVYIFKSEIRFRIPFDIWIIPVSLKGWAQLLKTRIT